MLRTILLAAAVGLTFGAGPAHAGGDRDRGHKGYDGGHRAYEHSRAYKHNRGYKHNWRYGHHYDPRPYRHHQKRNKAKRWHQHGPSWFDYRGRGSCHFAPRRVPVKVWDRHGNPYRKWVWRDVRVCV